MCLFWWSEAWGKFKCCFSGSLAWIMFWGKNWKIWLYGSVEANRRVDSSNQLGTNWKGDRASVIHSTRNIQLLIENGQHATPVKTALFRFCMSPFHLQPPPHPPHCSPFPVSRSPSPVCTSGVKLVEFSPGVIGGCDTRPGCSQWHLPFTQDDSQRHKCSMVPINYKGLGMDTHGKETSSCSINAFQIRSHRLKTSLGNLMKKCLVCKSPYQYSWKMIPFFFIMLNKWNKQVGDACSSFCANA